MIAVADRLWRVAEDDPDSDSGLYAERGDMDNVISCITGHSIVDR